MDIRDTESGSRKYDAKNTYDVTVTIENKPGVRDPEGDTILRDLVIKSGETSITGIVCSKNLRFTLHASSREEANRQVKAVCDSLRIYNPLVSRISLS